MLTSVEKRSYSHKDVDSNVTRKSLLDVLHKAHMS